MWRDDKITFSGSGNGCSVAIDGLEDASLLCEHDGNWVQSERKETGDIRPRPQWGSPPSKLNSEQLVILVDIIEANRDATLQELSNLLYEKTEIKVSRATLGRITKKLNQSFPKKFHRSPRKLAKK